MHPRSNTSKVEWGHYARISRLRRLSAGYLPTPLHRYIKVRGGFQYLYFDISNIIHGYRAVIGE